MEDPHRCANFEVLRRYGKSMMPVSVMDVNDASRSIAYREYLTKQRTFSIVPNQASKRGHDDPVEACALHRVGILLRI